MVDQTFFTKSEVEELFGTMTDTPDDKIFRRENINGEHALPQVYYIAAYHFADKVKRAWYALEINPEKEPEEDTFKRMQEACTLLIDTGSWPL